MRYRRKRRSRRRGRRRGRRRNRMGAKSLKTRYAKRVGYRM